MPLPPLKWAGSVETLYGFCIFSVSFALPGIFPTILFLLLPANVEVIRKGIPESHSSNANNTTKCIICLLSTHVRTYDFMSYVDFTCGMECMMMMWCRQTGKAYDRIQIQHNTKFQFEYCQEIFFLLEKWKIETAEKKHGMIDGWMHACMCAILLYGLLDLILCKR